MTDFPTRRSLRQAHPAPKGKGPSAPKGKSTGRRRAARTRSRGHMAAAGAATLLLVGSAMFAIPANAATTNSHTLYASELLAHSQSLTVDSRVKMDAIENTEYQAAVGTANTSSAPGKAGGAPVLTVGGVTNADWAALVLKDANLPVTSNNVTVMLQWMDSENDPASWFLRNNPLNNGLGSGGGAGFGSYDNLRTAASYVAQQFGRSLFSGIHDALAADSDPSVTEQAIIASPWASSHYGYGASFHAVNVPIVAAPASDWG